MNQRSKANQFNGAELLSTKEAAPYIGMTPGSIPVMRHLVSKGTVSPSALPPHLKIGRRVLYRVSDIEKWQDTKVMGLEPDE